MKNNNYLLLKLEILWWSIAGILAFLLILPIKIQLSSFPFLWQNILFVVCFVVLSRYLFFLEHTFIAKKQYLKIALIFLSIPLIFFLVTQLNYFQAFVDEGDLNKLLSSFPYKEQLKIEKYIRTEVPIIAMASIISAILFPFRMFMSVFRFRNSGRV